MKVVSITGLPGSGKSTAIEAIKDLGAVITMGDIVRNEAEKRGILPSGENLGKIARELRKKHGSDIIAHRCVAFIKSQSEEIIIVDGVRSFSEVSIFRKFWKFPIIAVLTSEEKRFERLLERGRSDDPESLEAIKKRDEREIEFGLKEVIEKSDYKIYNNSTVESLKKETREVFLKVLANY